MHVYKPTEDEHITAVEYVSLDGYIGYHVTTTKQMVRCLINDQQDCCERFDVDLNLPEGLCQGDVVGKKLLEIRYGKDDVRPSEGSYDSVFAVTIELVLEGDIVLSLTAYN